ncbi:MAG: outer membrane beta-barrel protein, partial [Candidatus Paceibacterota bacterium]
TKWQAGLSLSNAPSGSSETYSGYGTFAVTETVEEQYHFLANDTREQAYTDVKHHQPITFGLTLRYNLNERWSVASGLTYSQLSSELHSGSGNYYYDDRQTLHYIGLPLNIAYTFWQSPKLSAYLTSGGLVEKNVAGRLTSNYYLDDQLEITTRENISTDQLQWSVNTAIGLGYRISNNIGLYAEPGISYYFKNSSELETIYKENPLHFNLRLGLRFTLGE